MADRGGYHSSIFAGNCASSGNGEGNGALSSDTTPSQLASVDLVRYRRWQKDNLPIPQTIERAGYLPSSTHRQDTDYKCTGPDYKRRSSLSIESAATRKVSGSRSEGPGLEVGSRALRLGRKWVHYLGIILNSSVQGSLAIGMGI